MPLLETFGISENKMNLLLLLYDGPKKKQTILESLEISSQALVPTIRMLENNNIVIRCDDIYELSSIGKMAVDGMVPFLETLQFLDSNLDYLAEHKLDFIPFHLLKRLPEVCPYKILRPHFSEAFEFNKHLEETTKKSTTFKIATSLLLPSFPSFLSKWVEDGMEISIIVSEDLLGKIRAEHLSVFRELLMEDRIELLVYPGDMCFQTFVLNDHCFSCNLLTKKGAVSREQLISCNPTALDWGKELFEHYKECSIAVSHF